MSKFVIRAIAQDILGSIDLYLITKSKRHLAPKYSEAASLEVAPPPLISGSGFLIRSDSFVQYINFRFRF
jgi:hypothetical protein